MNQILNHDKDEKNKQSPLTRKIERFENYKTEYYNDKFVREEKLDTNRAMKIFAILLIIFGLIYMGSNSYVIAKSKEVVQKDNINVDTEKMGKEVTIKVTSTHPIQVLRYKWNEDQETSVSGTGKVDFETTVEIPNGNNILHVTIVDSFRK